METPDNEPCIVRDPLIPDDDDPPPLSPVSFLQLPTSPVSLIPETERQPLSDRVRLFTSVHFPGVTGKEWNNWHWQLRNSIRSTRELSRFLELTEHEISVSGRGTHALPLRITPYYLSLIDPFDPEQPLRKSIIPLFDELIKSPGEASDPLSEEHNSPVPGIVHRYPDRVLFLATGFCAAYCRYCTRTHMVAKSKCHVGTKAWETGLQYIAAHPEIRDVIVSGGDPLTMPDAHLDYLLCRLRRIPHLEIIRIGTKVPAVLPQRITRPLVNILKKYHPLFMSLHFTHPSELTHEVQEACERLAGAGIPLGSQTVLLRGINDDAGVMKQLMHGLLKIRVRPYYLYQCDPIPGSAHFRTPVSKGLEIIRSLRGHTSGYAVPQYVIDAPGGGGKIPLLPEYYLGHENGYALLRNYEGKVFRYPDNPE